ncbi:unnamed protein product, partial [Ixodes pacificus]
SRQTSAVLGGLARGMVRTSRGAVLPGAHHPRPNALRLRRRPLGQPLRQRDRDILDNPPAANLYQHLKTELTRRLSLSEDQKVRQLIQSAELAERKPSQFLRHMRALAGNTQVHDFL